MSVPLEQLTEGAHDEQNNNNNKTHAIFKHFAKELLFLKSETGYRVVNNLHY